MGHHPRSVWFDGVGVTGNGLTPDIIGSPPFNYLKGARPCGRSGPDWHPSCPPGKPSCVSALPSPLVAGLCLSPPVSTDSSPVCPPATGGVLRNRPCPA